ncbi:MAG: cytidine deaminase [Desulfovibrionaceae bacterium]
MDTGLRSLLDAARHAAGRAYAPYSGFRVGAAVLAGGTHYIGANVENASSNLGICAERVALATARLHTDAPVEAVAVFCLDAVPGADGRIAPHTVAPCGGCRQWLAELAPNAVVVTNATGPDGTPGSVHRVADLLPLPFALRADHPPRT